MLGGYEVVKRLCDGASAEVLLARAEDSGGNVIIELIRPELFREEELYPRYLEEMRLRRALAHPNVARRVREATALDGRPFLVSEPVGEVLRERLRTRGPLAPQALIKLAIPLCDALYYLHARGLVHGNLKAATVHLGVEGVTQRPKLVDYGLALFRPGRTLPRPPHRVLVEPEYLAPERIRGRRGTATSDVYAFGVLLHEALTGAPPFQGSPEQVRQAQLEAEPPPLPEQVSGRLRAIVRRCMAKIPSERFPNMLAVREALVAELDGTLPLPPPAPVEISLDEEGEEKDARPAPGQVIGRYTLLEPIGEGAMGRVFLARHTRLGRIVALKLLKSEHAVSRDHVERFVTEARAVNRIRNEHIVEIFDLVDEAATSGGRRVYCVMELLQGRTLGEQMNAGTVKLSRAVEVMRQVATALDAAHRAGVVHRDVKPDNIFLTRRDHEDFVKVVDFGVAKLREGVDPQVRLELPPSHRPGITQAGTVIGTPAYMSPEQVLGGPVDHRVDVFALGTVLYKLVAGVTPFSGVDFEDLSRKIAQEPPPPLPERAISGEPMPPALATLIRECLEKQPALRPNSAAEVASRLEAIYEHLTRARRPRPGMLRVLHLPRMNLSRWVALASAGVFALSVLALWPRPRTMIPDDQPIIVITPAPASTPFVKLGLQSDPPNADVLRTDTGEKLGRTPITVTVPRGESPVKLRFLRAGFQPAEVELPCSGDATAHVSLRPELFRSRRSARSN